MTLTLSYGLNFKDLYTMEGIHAIDRLFLSFLNDRDPALMQQVKEVRLKGHPDSLSESAFALSLAPILEDFLRSLFLLKEKKEVEDLSILYKIKRQFVQRVLLKRSCLNSLETTCLRDKMTTFLGQPFDEIFFAKKIEKMLEHGSMNDETLDFLAHYATWALHSKEGQLVHKNDIIFKMPTLVQFDQLIPFEDVEEQGVLKKYIPDAKARDGFHYPDEGLTDKEAFDAASYCVKCHPQGKDSCSKGMRDTEGKNKINPLGNVLSGCPLKQKISEMMVMYEQGYTLGALSIVMIDNPLLAMTGYRICNDCMKGCIFQKQDPVNVPGVESTVLRNILHLPKGFEIYSLLTRWNPLKSANFIESPIQKKSVLVVGLGPAGIALSYYLLRAGFHVVAIDGTKIERLSERWVGSCSKPLDFDPVVDVSDVFDDLESRVIQGFGGVMEYGITVRWDKNLLTLMRLVLERHQHFRLYDGVRFGGTIGFQEARDLGVDHVAFCVGAGEPKKPLIHNVFSKGIRFASDFLMSLQLTGAYKKESYVNMDIELPLIVLGAGLTAIDTATEALAYYPRLVERFYQTYQKLVEKIGETRIQACWNEEERERAMRYIEHAKALMEERRHAEKEGRSPNFLPLLNLWGGVTLICRTPINQTQSYKLNHEELLSAMQMGVRVVDSILPHSFLKDGRGHVCALKGTAQQGKSIEIKARSVLIATGTSDNTIVSEESGEILNFESGLGVGYSRWGDYHPEYAGSVVKAIASVKDRVDDLVFELGKTEKIGEIDFRILDEALRPHIVAIRTLAPTIVELVVKAPLAAKRSKPGQFFKIQPYDRDVGSMTKGVALSRAWVDEALGHIGFIVLEHGASTQLIRSLHVGDAIHLMGPTGAPTEIKPVQTLLMIGGGLGNAVLFSVGQAYRALGTRVIYIAAYKEEEKIFKFDDIEEAADSVVWSIENASTFKARRANDHVVRGTVIDGLRYVMEGPLRDRCDIEKLLVIGSEGMTWAVKKTLEDSPSVFPTLNSKIAGVNSPMQCMMKGICGQCVQKHHDPKTKEDTFIFSCKNQDQNLETLDSEFLAARLAQNRASEKLHTLMLESQTSHISVVK